MERLAAWTVLVLGALVLIGGVVGLVDGVRGDGMGAPLPRLLLILLVVLAMRRAIPKARSARAAAGMGSPRA